MSALYHAEGIADAVDFKLSPAIRSHKKNENKKKKPHFQCVDEKKGCDEEEYYLCAAQNNVTNVDFLACMDAAKGSPTSKAQGCAKSASASWDKISACFSGAQGKQLLTQASQYFETKFPKSVGVPHIEVNGKALDQSKVTYKGMLQALCATGIKAGACNHEDTLIVL